MTIDDRMLKELGIEDVEALFADIPTDIRKDRARLCRDGLDEHEVVRPDPGDAILGPELGKGTLLPRRGHL